MTEQPGNTQSLELSPQSRIYVAGHRGLVGSAIMRRLQQDGYGNVVTRTHGELDLSDQNTVHDFFHKEKPAYVFLCAAKVGGILANSTYPADFIYQNLAIQTNVIHAAWQAGVKRLLFLGSSCIYPRGCPQPIKEEYLLTGPLEPTNRPYAVAKIVGIEMCWAYNRQYGTRFLAIMPTNLFGPADNYDLESSHVVPALIRKMHEAKVKGSSAVSVWGTGKPRREFLYSDDLGDAALYLMNLPDRQFGSLASDRELPPLINIGTGKDLTIRELAELIKEVVGFDGHLEWDTSKPDGTLRKQLDTSRMRALGWTARMSLVDAIKLAYEDYHSLMERSSELATSSK